jgi:hypothetical protein
MQTEQPKLSRYLQAGSPLSCFLESCQKPFIGTCIHANDGHFYCSHACSDDGERERPIAKVEQFRPRKK